MEFQVHYILNMIVRAISLKSEQFCLPVGLFL